MPFHRESGRSTGLAHQGADARQPEAGRDHGGPDVRRRGLRPRPCAVPGRRDGLAARAAARSERLRRRPVCGSGCGHGRAACAAPEPRRPRLDPRRRSRRRLRRRARASTTDSSRRQWRARRGVSAVARRVRPAVRCGRCRRTASHSHPVSRATRPPAPGPVTGREPPAMTVRGITPTRVCSLAKTETCSFAYEIR